VKEVPTPIQSLLKFWLYQIKEGSSHDPTTGVICPKEMAQASRVNKVLPPCTKSICASWTLKKEILLGRNGE